jgi:hypothetical protein
MIFRSCGSLRCSHFCQGGDVPRGQDSLDLILLAQLKQCLICLQGSIFSLEMRALENDRARIVRNDAAIGLHDGRIGAVEHNVDLG